MVTCQSDNEKQIHSLPTCLCNRMHGDTNSSFLTWINHYQT